MKLQSQFGVGLLIILVLFFSHARGATVTVRVGPQGAMSFSPDPVSIQVGDTVQWIWDSSNHSVTSGTPFQPTSDFNSGIRNPPSTFSRTFGSAGSFPYYCTFHPEMKGTIIVK